VEIGFDSDFIFEFDSRNEYIKKYARIKDLTDVAFNPKRDATYSRLFR